MLSRTLHTSLAPLASLAGSLSESEANRRIWLAAGGLALLGVVLTICTIWWWRSTKAEHPSLAPLEVMSARRWSRSTDAERSRLVERVRPQGAGTAAPGREPEPVDLSVLAAGDHAGFEDLKEMDELLGLDLATVSAMGSDHDTDAPADDADDELVPVPVQRIAPRADAPDDDVLPATPAPTVDPSADLDALLRSFGASTSAGAGNAAIAGPGPGPGAGAGAGAEAGAGTVPSSTIEPPEWLRSDAGSTPD